MNITITYITTSDPSASVCDFATARNNHRAFGSIIVKSGNRLQHVCDDCLPVLLRDWARDDDPAEDVA